MNCPYWAWIPDSNAAVSSDRKRGAHIVGALGDILEDTLVLAKVVLHIGAGGQQVVAELREARFSTDIAPVMLSALAIAG